MSSTSSILLGAALAAVGVVAFKMLHGKPADGTSTGGGGACELLCTAAQKATGVPVDVCKQGAAYKACRAASDWFGPPWDLWDQQNKALNGAVEIELVPELAKLTSLTVPIPAGQAFAYSGANPSAVHGNRLENGALALHGTVLRFANGGVPFEGAPGWEKCAPGTKSMLDSTASAAWTGSFGDPQKRQPMRINLAFTGATGDPTSQGPASGGVHWWKGKRFVCSAGVGPTSTIDHRDGFDRPACKGADGAPPTGLDPRDGFGGGHAEPTTGGGGTHVSSGSVGGTPENPPAGFVWVASPAPGHWERPRA